MKMITRRLAVLAALSVVPGLAIFAAPATASAGQPARAGQAAGVIGPPAAGDRLAARRRRGPRVRPVLAAGQAAPP